MICTLSIYWDFATRAHSIIQSSLNCFMTQKRRNDAYQRWSREHKVRGQGPTFRGQTLSRPRTGMLETKDTTCKFSQKKRSSLKLIANFPKIQAISKNKGLQKLSARSLACSKTNKIVMILAHFQQIKK